MGPRAELKIARLYVEGEELCVKSARASQYRLGHPDDVTGMFHHNEGSSLFTQSFVGTGQGCKLKKIQFYGKVSFAMAI